MRKIDAVFALLLVWLPLAAFSQGYFVWNGTSGSDWHTPANWSPSGVPGITDTAFIPPVAFVTPSPVLNANAQIAWLIMPAGSLLNLGNRILEIHDKANLDGANLSNGTVQHRGLGDVLLKSCVLNNFVLEKHSNGSVRGEGGNTFNGNTVLAAMPTVTSGFFRMAETSGDVFNGPVECINRSPTGSFSMSFAESGVTSINTNDLKLSITSPGSILWGSGVGSISISNGGVIPGALGIISGSIQIRNMTQTGSSANDLGLPTFLDVQSSSFAGDFTCQAQNAISLVNSTFSGKNSFRAPNLFPVQSCIFSSALTSSTFQKLASGASNNNEWPGGNQFYNATITNLSNQRLRISNPSADVFFGNTLFENIGSNGILEIAYRGNCLFTGDVLLRNISGQGITIGSNNMSDLATINGNLKVSIVFSGGALRISRINQTASTPNDLFTPTILNISNSTFEGDFHCIATGNIQALNTSIFKGNNTFTGSKIIGVGNSSFSPNPGTSTVFTKTGGTADTWNGGNIFGDVTIINNTIRSLRLNNSPPNTFKGPAHFQQLNPAGSIDPCRGGPCYFEDDISTVGTISPISFGTNNNAANVNITGNKLQTLKGSSIFPPVFRNLTMNTTGTLHLQVPLTITRNSTFTNGILQSSATNPLIYDATAPIPAGGSNASHVDGPVRRSGNGNFRFPVGDNGQYAYVLIAPSGAFGTFEVQYFNSPFSSFAVDGSLDHASQCEYWQIDRTGSVDPVSLTMTYDNIRSCGITLLPDLRLAHWDGSKWTSIGGVATGTLASGTITASGVNTFSPFTLASFSVANPLPIELLFFSAKPSGKVVDLAWATASEKDNEYFTVERSSDGIRFEPLLHVPGAGNSTETLHYYEADEKPLPGISYYRLRQTDFNGDFSYSNVVAVQMPLDDKTFAVYPNPASGHFLLETGADITQLRYRLLNSMGQTMPVAPAAEAGRLRFSTQGLPAGLYFLEVQYRNEAQTLKVIVR